MIVNLNTPEELNDVTRGYGIVQVQETTPFEYQVTVWINFVARTRVFKVPFIVFKEDTKKKKGERYDNSIQVVIFIYYCM